MSGGPSIIRKPGLARSNQELVNSLRDNFASAQELNSVPEHSLCKNPAELWTDQSDGVLWIPRINWAWGGLRDDVDQYEITVKLFLLQGTPVQEREQYIKEALTLVSKELGTTAIDLLVLSFPGLSFEGTCEMKAGPTQCRARKPRRGDRDVEGSRGAAEARTGQALGSSGVRQSEAPSVFAAIKRASRRGPDQPQGLLQCPSAAEETGRRSWHRAQCSLRYHRYLAKRDSARIAWSGRKRSWRAG